MPGLPHASPKGPPHSPAPYPRWQHLRAARGREGKHRTAGGSERSGVRSGPEQMAKREEGEQQELSWLSRFPCSLCRDHVGAGIHVAAMKNPTLEQMNVP